MNPSNVLMSVLLPAPLGPSRPTAPGANAVVTYAKNAAQVTVTFSSVTTDVESGIRFDIRSRGPKRSGRLQCSLQTQRVGALAHESDHIRDVLFERQTE